MNKRWIVSLKKDSETEDLILPLNDNILQEVGWKIGDVIEWVDNKDGSWTMKKKEKTQWVLVETVSLFRQRYMVEVPIGKSSWALDDVVMNEAKEFSQKHLDETIVSHRVVTKEEAMKLCNDDNDYARVWNDEKKIEVFFTTLKEHKDDAA
jgi:hypothetical protein